MKKSILFLGSYGIILLMLTLSCALYADNHWSPGEVTCLNRYTNPDKAQQAKCKVEGKRITQGSKTHNISDNQNPAFTFSYYISPDEIIDIYINETAVETFDVGGTWVNDPNLPSITDVEFREVVDWAGNRDTTKLEVWGPVGLKFRGAAQKWCTIDLVAHDYILPFECIEVNGSSPFHHVLVSPVMVSLKRAIDRWGTYKYWLDTNIQPWGLGNWCGKEYKNQEGCGTAQTIYHWRFRS